jgi:hypothetical protein
MLQDHLTGPITAFYDLHFAPRAVFRRFILKDDRKPYLGCGAAATDATSGPG